MMRVKAVLLIDFDDDELGENDVDEGIVPATVSDAIEEILGDRSIEETFFFSLPTPNFVVQSVSVVHETEKLVERLEETVQHLKARGWTQTDITKALVLGLGD